MFLFSLIIYHLTEFPKWNFRYAAYRIQGLIRYIVFKQEKADYKALFPTICERLKHIG